jgi:tousled-like kinase
VLAYCFSDGHRELRRLQDEEASRMALGTTLNERYVLIRLLGKGGFSEVFQV